jgi:hypothetical protein
VVSHQQHVIIRISVELDTTTILILIILVSVGYIIIYMEVPVDLISSASRSLRYPHTHIATRCLHTTAGMAGLWLEYGWAPSPSILAPSTT